MKLTWTIALVLPTEQVGANNTEKSTIILQLNDKDILAVDFIGRSAPKTSWLIAGDNVTVECKISSREYNGKYYTGVVWFDVSADVSKDESYSKAGKPADDMDIPFN